ncbi:carbamoyl-phosphate synthase small subunit [Melghirimyces profundicolus]|uniref:Carbamoyl phosphate synthase small chain n=1 Tax=Melghirimyces profundicolus TaxID=1242148 RepID=A0A2T6BUD2_9BACL|nr:carbamoyl phosphate synthase small subunit [Melghirimyces profundicolus]PTX59681.1 carbamoyl-phosphate synthase small subunit [Melghirimyces profundicolus]
MEAYLVFEDGEAFPGVWIGTPREVPGEVVFTTGMTGYQEVTTDPSYAGQIVTFTYPLIGNYGTVRGESESDRPHCAGIVVSECWQETGSGLGKWLDAHGVPGISGVDTRAVVKKVRENGGIRGVIASDPHPRVKEWPDPLSLQWVEGVSVKEPVSEPSEDSDAPHIVLLDFGVKASMVRSLTKRGCRVTKVPYFTDPKKVERLAPDGLLFSNGPGDPKALLPFLEGWVPLIRRIPSMGICLGHQLLALALGADTERLPFGHRGSNHPVREPSTGKVWITSQNHGYTVRTSSVDTSDWEITHLHVNDGSVEGLAHRHFPVFSVQFHPEAHPGPADAETLFDRFLEKIRKGKEVAVHG